LSPAACGVRMLTYGPHAIHPGNFGVTNKAVPGKT
jgi:hypothetical protein